MKVLTGKAMREADRLTIESYGLPGAVLMENAGQRIFEFIAVLSPAPAKTVILAGPGNNGGDGLVLARLLAGAGYPVSLWSTVKPGSYRGDAALNEKYLIKQAFPINRLLGEAELVLFREELKNADLIVDALLGTGADRPVEGLAANMIRALNEAPAPVIAVDVPSGINADTGEIMGAAVEADWTITFAFPKLGHFLYPGAGHSGTLYVGHIHIPASLVDDEKTDLLLPDAVLKSLPPRPGNAHKGSLGRVLIVAGSPGMTGAAALAAQSALKGGAGLVYLAAPESCCPALETKLIEVIVIALPESAPGIIDPEAASVIIERARNCDALAVGPGLLPVPETVSLLNKLIQLSPVPLVLDAGALEALGRNLNILRSARHLPVLTPHPGEMARMVGLSAGEVQKDRIAVAVRNAGLWNSIVMLKGANTVIASPDGKASINPTGNVSLATAGSGDLLTGLITSFIAQGMKSKEAAEAGAYLHGLAGDLLGPDRGGAALDILNNFKTAFNSLKEANEVRGDSPYLTKIRII